MTRIYQARALQTGQAVQLDPLASHHIARVLRMTVAEPVTLFNGDGGEFAGVIRQIDKKHVTVEIQQFIDREVESPLNLVLAQGISRGEKMDFTIQKAVELGIKHIIPLLTERCNVKLDQARSEKRIQHWQSVIISACEQSGRNRIPTILAPQSFAHWLEQSADGYRFILSPHVEQKLPLLSLKNAEPITIVIGPEGGMSESEIQSAMRKGFLPLNLGPRVLRTETAAIAAMTVMQCCLGDLK